MITPLGPRVLIKRLPPEKLAASIIEVIEFSGSPSSFGTILAVGNGYQKENGLRTPLDMVVGDTVVVKPYSGASLEVEIDGQIVEAYMVMETDILAVLKE
jgi:chaperonin GroES